MSDGPFNLVLEHLLAIGGDLSGLHEDVRDLGRRITSLEMASASLHGDFAGQSMRIDRLEQRLDRIEHRLEIGDA
jgi:hypothetical protein